jgi:L-aspartate oxidase
VSASPPLADVLVVGAGIAGAAVAIRLADAGLQVDVLARTPLGGSASAQALGGIAAALGPDDSPALHLEDTLAAGAGLCHPAIARRVVEAAAGGIAWLIEQGVAFDRADGELDLTLEGGHSRRRVVHSADSTGRALMAALGHRLVDHPRIALLLEHAAVDLLVVPDPVGPDRRRCAGVLALDAAGETLRLFPARRVVLATGGASGVYTVSSNAVRPVGDGIAMAWRAGCRVADLELVQFHPTALRHPEAEGWLVTEAVRGEGGRLLLPDGERFMFRYHPRGELAPRDVVARAMHAEMVDRNLDHLRLDISHADPDFVRQRFPNAVQRCAELGIDITREPMPVAPAAHYICGGVLSDATSATDLPGLYAIGETACTGLHGANRLASNSLLEGLVFAAAASQAILADTGAAERPPDVPESTSVAQPGALPAETTAEIARLAAAIRHTMSTRVGIVRDDRGLAEALRALEGYSALAQSLFERYGATGQTLELRNMACVATLIARSALLRKESRGAHFNSDHPEPGPTPADTLLTPGRHGGSFAPLGRAIA